MRAISILAPLIVSLATISALGRARDATLRPVRLPVYKEGRSASPYSRFQARYSRHSPISRRRKTGSTRTRPADRPHQPAALSGVAIAFTRSRTFDKKHSFG